MQCLRIKIMTVRIGLKDREVLIKELEHFYQWKEEMTETEWYSEIGFEDAIEDAILEHIEVVESE